MTFLKNVGEFEQLDIEKILFEFDKIPMVFVCMNSEHKRYLSVCTDCMDGFSWLICEIDNKVLLQVLKDEIPILKAFELAQGKISLVWKKSTECQVVKYLFEEIPKEELPDEEEKLENPFLKDYISTLEIECAIDKLYRDIQVKASDYECYKWINNELPSLHIEKFSEKFSDYIFQSNKKISIGKTMTFHGWNKSDRFVFKEQKGQDLINKNLQYRGDKNVELRRSHCC